MEHVALVTRVRSEFNEMPGLQLTPSQASRLWGLEADTCRDVIDALVDADFLRWTAKGTVVRVDRPATRRAYGPLETDIPVDAQSHLTFLFD